jgi:hypothetical protein
MFVREYSILKLPKIERVLQKVVGVYSFDLAGLFPPLK